MMSKSTVVSCSVKSSQCEACPQPSTHQVALAVVSMSAHVVMIGVLVKQASF